MKKYTYKERSWSAYGVYKPRDIYPWSSNEEVWLHQCRDKYAFVLYDSTNKVYLHKASGTTNILTHARLFSNRYQAIEYIEYLKHLDTVVLDKNKKYDIELKQLDNKLSYTWTIKGVFVDIRVISTIDATKKPIRYSDEYKVIALCGSTKFKDEFLKVQQDLTLSGNIVLSPGVFGHTDNIVLSPSTKEMLDDIHKRKIDRADEIYVINVGGYIGESTRAEIEYAKETNKPIRYYEYHQA